jgi:recombination protein RecT
MSKNELATKEQVAQLRQYLEAPTVLAELQKAMPNNLDPKRLVRQVMTLAQTNPDLLLCTQLSVLTGCIKAAELGLELTGPLGHAYLVPRKNKQTGAREATFQTGWKGLVLLAFRSGNVASMPVRTVHENDEFEVEYGTDQRIVHRPAKKDRGAAAGYYAVVNYKSGGKDFEYLTKEEVIAHKAKYGGDGPAWRTSFDAMAMKTALRMLCRRVSLCPQAQAQATEEEYEEMGVAMTAPAPPGTRTGEVLDHVDQMLLPAPEAAGEAQDQQEGRDAR